MSVAGGRTIARNRTGGADPEESRDVSLTAGEVRWLDAQVHSGETIGQTPTHVLFVELEERSPLP